MPRGSFYKSARLMVHEAQMEDITRDLYTQNELFCNGKPLRGLILLAWEALLRMKQDRREQPQKRSRQRLPRPYLD